jgi:hypothetical protein
MNPELNITVTHTKVHEDMTPEAIAGGIRPGCSTGAPECAGELLPTQAGLP